MWWARSEPGSNWLESLVFIKKLTRSASDGYFTFCSWLCTFPFGSVFPSTLHWPDLGVLHGLLGPHPFGCNWMRVKSFWKWPLKESISSRLYSERDLVCVCHSQRCQSYCLLILQWLCHPSFALEGWALLPRMTLKWLRGYGWRSIMFVCGTKMAGF